MDLEIVRNSVSVVRRQKNKAMAALVQCAEIGSTWNWGRLRQPQQHRQCVSVHLKTKQCVWTSKHHTKDEPQGFKPVITDKQHVRIIWGNEGWKSRTKVAMPCDVHISDHEKMFGLIVHSRNLASCQRWMCMAARPTRQNQVDKYLATKFYVRSCGFEIKIGKHVEFRTCDHFLHHLCMKQCCCTEVGEAGMSIANWPEDLRPPQWTG